MKLTSRRTLLGATAALAALPAAAIAAPTTPAPIPPAPAAAGSDALRQMWDEVINLSIRLGGHPTPLVSANSGLPGWMHATGEAHELGQARYNTLVAMLNAQPQSAEDVALMARAASHIDIQTGPKSFAAERLARAAMTLAA